MAHPFSYSPVGTSFAHLPRLSARSFGWERVDSPREATLQWGKARDIDWRAVLDGELAANSYYLKTALTRKADLAKLVAKHAKLAGSDAAAPAAVPETHVIDSDLSLIHI